MSFRSGLPPTQLARSSRNEDFTPVIFLVLAASGQASPLEPSPKSHHSGLPEQRKCFELAACGTTHFGVFRAVKLRPTKNNY